MTETERARLAQVEAEVRTANAGVAEIKKMLREAGIGSVSMPEPAKAVEKTTGSKKGVSPPEPPPLSDYPHPEVKT